MRIGNPTLSTLAVRLFVAACVALCFTPGQTAATEDDTPILLVAKPTLLDPNFFKTVVLVIRPAEGGPLGVILNRPIKVTIKEAFPDHPALSKRSDPLHFGGPVRPQALMFLFRSKVEPQHALPVIDDLYMSGHSDQLDQVLRNGGAVRFFFGYSGWAPAQLEMEVARDSWWVLPADLDTVWNADPRTLWQEMVRRATAIRAGIEPRPARSLQRAAA